MIALDGGAFAVLFWGVIAFALLWFFPRQSAGFVLLLVASIFGMTLLTWWRIPGQKSQLGMWAVTIPAVNRPLIILLAVADLAFVASVAWWCFLRDWLRLWRNGA